MFYDVLGFWIPVEGLYESQLHCFYTGTILSLRTLGSVRDIVGHDSWGRAPLVSAGWYAEMLLTSCHHRTAPLTPCPHQRIFQPKSSIVLKLRTLNPKSISGGGHHLIRLLYLCFSTCLCMCMFWVGLQWLVIETMRCLRFAHGQESVNESTSDPGALAFKWPNPACPKICAG